MSSKEKLKKNFNNPELRKEFEYATGLKADENPAAFIGYINSAWIESTGNLIIKLQQDVTLLLHRQSG